MAHMVEFWYFLYKFFRSETGSGEISTRGIDREGLCIVHLACFVFFCAGLKTGEQGTVRNTGVPAKEATPDVRFFLIPGTHGDKH